MIIEQKNLKKKKKEEKGIPKKKQHNIEKQNKMNIKHHLNNSTNDEFHMQTLNTFPLQINTQNNISCLKQMMNFICKH